MWTHREKCLECNWNGYYMDLDKRYLNEKEKKKLKEGMDKNKKYLCCPKCNSLKVEGCEIDDSHLQGI